MSVNLHARVTERSVGYLGRLLALDILWLELGEKSVPVFLLQCWVLRKLTLDHERFDMVDGMNVLDAVFHNSPDLHIGAKFERHNLSVSGP